MAIMSKIGAIAAFVAWSPEGGKETTASALLDRLSVIQKLKMQKETDEQSLQNYIRSEFWYKAFQPKNPIGKGDRDQLKNLGTEAFKQQTYSEAIKKYLEALETAWSQGDTKELRDFAGICASNICLCFKELKKGVTAAALALVLIRNGHLVGKNYGRLIQALKQAKPEIVYNPSFTRTQKFYNTFDQKQKTLDDKETILAEMNRIEPLIVGLSYQKSTQSGLHVSQYFQKEVPRVKHVLRLRGVETEPCHDAENITFVSHDISYDTTKVRTLKRLNPVDSLVKSPFTIRRHVMPYKIYGTIIAQAVEGNALTGDQKKELWSTYHDMYEKTPEELFLRDGERNSILSILSSLIDNPEQELDDSTQALLARIIAWAPAVVREGPASDVTDPMSEIVWDDCAAFDDSAGLRKTYEAIVQESFGTYPIRYDTRISETKLQEFFEAFQVYANKISFDQLHQDDLSKPALLVNLKASKEGACVPFFVTVSDCATADLAQVLKKSVFRKHRNHWQDLQKGIAEKKTDEKSLVHKTQSQITPIESMRKVVCELEESEQCEEEDGEEQDQDIANPFLLESGPEVEELWSCDDFVAHFSKAPLPQGMMGKNIMWPPGLWIQFRSEMLRGQHGYELLISGHVTRFLSNTSKIDSHRFGQMVRDFLEARFLVENTDLSMQEALPNEDAVKTLISQQSNLSSLVEYIKVAQGMIEEILKTGKCGTKLPSHTPMTPQTPIVKHYEEQLQDLQQIYVSCLAKCVREYFFTEEERQSINIEVPEKLRDSKELQASMRDLTNTANKKVRVPMPVGKHDWIDRVVHKLHALTYASFRKTIRDFWYDHINELSRKGTKGFHQSVSMLTGPGDQKQSQQVKKLQRSKMASAGLMMDDTADAERYFLKLCDSYDEECTRKNEGMSCVAFAEYCAQSMKEDLTQAGSTQILDQQKRLTGRSGFKNRKKR